MTISAAELSLQKHAPSVEGVLPAILHRWSPRSFADREVSLADLQRIFEAVRWSPSSMNEQPWRYLVGLRGTETHEKIFAALEGTNKEWAGKAPVLLLSVTKAKFSRHDFPNGSAIHDLGMANAALALQATTLGLSTHFMAGYDQAAARTAFAIPEDFTMGVAVALGYQGEPDALGSDGLVQREIAPRVRKDLAEFVFTAWNQPAQLE